MDPEYEYNQENYHHYRHNRYDAHSLDKMDKSPQHEKPHFVDVKEPQPKNNIYRDPDVWDPPSPKDGNIRMHKFEPE